MPNQQGVIIELWWFCYAL